MVNDGAAAANAMANATWETWFVFALIATAGVLFASGRVRYDVVALLTVVALTVSGVLTARESLAGFGDPVVILVAAILVIGEMLNRTGITQIVGKWMTHAGGSSEVRLVVLTMVVASIVGAFMSSTAVVAMFVPVVLAISASTGTSPSRLLMPLCYGALVSGMMTLIATTPNIVVSAELVAKGFEPFGFFSFTPIGIAVLLTSLGYMLVLGRGLLPKHPGESTTPGRPKVSELLEEFGLIGRMQMLAVPQNSSLVGRSLDELELDSRYDARVALVERQGSFARRVRPAPDPQTMLRFQDKLLLHTDAETAKQIAEENGFEQAAITTYQYERWQVEAGVATVLIPPESKLIGTTVSEIGFRTRYGIEVLGIKRKGELIQEFSTTPLKASDVLLVVGPWSRLQKLSARTQNLIVLNMPIELEQAAPARRRAPIAAAILVSMVALSALEVVPVVIAVLIAVLIAVGTRCLSMEDGYNAINWNSVVLIAGLLPVADAMEKTGGAMIIVEAIVTALGDAGPYALLSAFFFLTAGFSLFLSNTATAVLIAPIAIRTAEALSFEPYAFAMTVAIAASAAFMTPVSTPAATLVVVPGKYSFTDFVRVGTPLMLLTWIVVIAIVPMVFPL